MAIAHSEITPEPTVQSLAKERVVAKRKARLSLVPPPVPAGPPSVTLESNALAEAIRYVRGCILTDKPEKRPILAGIYLSDGYAVAADGFKLARYAVATGAIKGLIPRESIELLAKYHDRDLTLTQEKPDLLSVTGLPGQQSQDRATTYIRLTEGNYPTSEAIIKSASTLFVNVSAGPLAAIARAVMTEQEWVKQSATNWAKNGNIVLKSVPIDPPILRWEVTMQGDMSFTRKDGSDPITLKVAVDPPVPLVYEPFPKKMGKREIAKITREREAEQAQREHDFYAQPPFVGAVNGNHLATLLAPLPTGAQVRIGFTLPNHPIKLTSPQAPDWTAVLMPMYLEKPKVVAFNGASSVSPKTETR